MSLKIADNAPPFATKLPLLLFDDECAVCRRIGAWVKKSAAKKSSGSTIFERPIGVDPVALRALNPDLDIWDAYQVIHLLMPDGTMRKGGEAVAEVLRNLPNTQWLAKSFNFSVLGFRPFQEALNLGYVTLAASRPLLGCESCGTPAGWMKPLRWVVNEYKACFGKRRKRIPTHHFTPLPSARKAPVAL